MTGPLDLKSIERKAFRSTYQDGLWDIYLGLVVIAMAIFIYHPAEGYSPVNIFLAIGLMLAAYSVFWAGKKLITVPRMGQVRFGPLRKQKKTTLAFILGVVILIQVGVVVYTTLAWRNPAVGVRVNDILPEQDRMRLVVATIASLFVGPSMILVAYFSDFPRGYTIAVMMALAVFLMVYLNQPIFPIVIGGLIILPGLVLFVRFMRRYPKPGDDNR